MATVTLAQWAQLEKQPLKKGIMLGLAMEGVILDLLSWRSIGGLSETGIRYDEVPEPDWIALDGAINSKAANGKPISFSVHQLALHIDVPRLLEKKDADVLERQSVRQTKLALKGAAYKVNDAFINGDQSGDPNQFEGLNKLVAQLDSSQTIGSTEIDLTASYTDAIAESLFYALDQGIYATEGHGPTAAFANSTFLLKMESIGRQYKLRGDNFDWNSATFDVGDVRSKISTKASKPAFKYRGVPFFDLGKKADQTTQIIGNTYTEGGSTAHGTRVFFAKYGEEDLEGIQAEPLDVVDIGILENKDVIRKRVLGTLGLACWGPRSITKVQGIRAI